MLKMVSVLMITKLFPDMDFVREQVNAWTSWMMKCSEFGMFMQSQERNTGEAKRDTIIERFAALFLESFQSIGVINYKRSRFCNDSTFTALHYNEGSVLSPVYYINDTHVAATVTPAVIQPIISTFQPPDVALLDGALVPVAVEVEDEVGEAVLCTVSM